MTPDDIRNLADRLKDLSRDWVDCGGHVDEEALAANVLHALADLYEAAEAIEQSIGSGHSITRVTAQALCDALARLEAIK